MSLNNYSLSKLFVRIALVLDLREIRLVKVVVIEVVLLVVIVGVVEVVVVVIAVWLQEASLFIQ